MKKLIQKIKTKQFKDLDETVIKETIERILKRNPRLAKGKFDNEKSAAFKQIVRLGKQELHYQYGAFQKKSSQRKTLLEELKRDPANEEIKNKILQTHSSTRERLTAYARLKEDIVPYTKNKTILDLGCGLNPLMFDENDIIAIEFNKIDVDFLNEYFTIKNKRSKAVLIDLKKDIDKLQDIKADTVFAWKLFDLLTPKEAEAVIKKCNATYLIASFSTETLGKKRMNKPQRTWFEMMLKRIGYEWHTKEYDNEIFYMIRLKHGS
jgi:hypothetical protein